jgi:glycosyltransferase involved in cell wall biosynthesis
MGDTEGLGVVLLEALRFERPVVASAVGGIKDVVHDGRTGWLVPPADPEALARALDAVAEDPEEARARARAGRADAALRFGWDRVLAETARVYESAVARRRHPDGL